MGPAKSEQLKRYLLEILELGVQERTEFLAELGRRDLALRQAAEAWIEPKVEVPAARRPPHAGSEEPARPAATARASDTTPPIGHVGPYILLGELGRGGQAVVYVARDPQLPRRVALKVLTGFEAESKCALERFRREAELTSRLEHPGICPVYDWGIEEGLPYIAMRLIEGKTLADTIAAARGDGASDPTIRLADGEGDGHTKGAGGPRTPSTEPEIGSALVLIEKAARALHVAYEAKILHRDIKPGNIMVTADGEPVIMDFGLARDEDSQSPILTRTGDVFGTPAYMSPEQVSPHRGGLDRRTDVWSLGVCLYECLTLRRPFDAPTRAGLYEAIRMKEPPDPRRLNPSISSDLATVIATALEKDPDHRYATAAALAEDLRRVREREPILARPVSRWTKLVRWAQRNPAVAALTATVFLVLVTGLVATLMQKAKADANAAQLQLSADAGEAAQLLELAENELWPANEEIVPRIDAWLLRAEPILARLPGYRRELEELRLSASPLATEALAREEAAREAVRAEIASLDKKEASEAGSEADDEKGVRIRLAAAEKILADADADEGARERAERIRSEAEAAIETASVRLQIRLHHRQELRVRLARLATRQTFSFENPAVQARHNRLAEAVSRAEELERAKAKRPGLLAIERRRAFAESLKRRTIDAHKTQWETAIVRVEANPKYSGLRLSPQPGLIPLGRDLGSTLEEFCETATGETPVRNGAGKLNITGKSAIVFVLLPGGSFTIGAQNQDPNAPNFDPLARPDEGPPHSVALVPFLLSKYEMTQGQWLRFTGKNPSYYRPETYAGVLWRHPVENMSWDEAQLIADRLGLFLPAEAQWEYGCRGATSTPWWPGSEKRSLLGVANIADERYRREGGSGYPEEWDDPHAIHAQVGDLIPNGFGLHDVHGNVLEWCEDWYGSYTDRVPRAGDGLMFGPSVSGPGVRYSVFRGGGFNSPAIIARSACRQTMDPWRSGMAVGVRLVRRITP